MPPAWKEITEAVAAGAVIDKASDAALAVGAAWIQETRDLGLQLTDLLHQPVMVKLTRAERDDPVAFMGRALDGLCGEQALEVEYVIPDGVLEPCGSGGSSEQVAREQHDDRGAGRPKDGEGSGDVAPSAAREDP